ncbi:MAG: hypothetical protein ACRDI2_26385 [Chloroflexota bacterium]
MAASYALMDTDTFNMVGSFRSRAAALRAVAETARLYGEESEEARSLVLFRQDGSADDAHVAEGEALVRLALAAEPHGRRNGAANVVAHMPRVASPRRKGRASAPRRNRP